MPSKDPKVRKLSCTIAAVERHNPDADTTSLREELQAARFEERARALVADWPAFSEEKRAGLRPLLRPILTAIVGREAA